MSTTPIPFSITTDPYDLHNTLEAFVTERFLAGAFSAVRTRSLQRLRRDAPLVPDGVVAIRTVKTHAKKSLLAEGEGWMLFALRYPAGTGKIVVAAETDEIAKRVLTEAIDGACTEPEDSKVPVAFWHASGDCFDRTTRDIAAPMWAAVRHNYNGRVMAAFDALSVFGPNAVDGRLLLLHGPPGTGKTSALRSLASAWRSWCRFEIVIDTERLFGDAGYLMSVLLGEDDDDDSDESREADAPSSKWRILVLEDCDELLRVDAKKQTGQALSRLLNLTDGFLGQGLQVLVALTTNEPLSALHPAIVRPGRCAAEVHVDKFTTAEAAKWLAAAGYDGAAPVGGATLAQMYALVGATDGVRAGEVPAPTGTYL